MKLLYHGRHYVTSMERVNITKDGSNRVHPREKHPCNNKRQFVCLIQEQKLLLVNLGNLESLNHGRYDVTSLERVKKTKHGSSQLSARGSARVYTATYYTKIDKTYTWNSMKNVCFTCENTKG